MSRQDGGWLFISYANEDIEQVRQIRNTLEEQGFKPILFYLKCMEHNTNDQELKSLIHREIAARKWFLLIDSENAKDSEWVQDEVAFVRNFPDKKVFTVDLSGDIHAQLTPIMAKARVFLSYSHHDTPLINRLFQRLVASDFLVCSDWQLVPGKDFPAAIARNIKEVCEKGFFLPLVTNNYLQSWSCREALYFALQQEGTVLPVIAENTDLPAMIQLQLSGHSWISIGANPSDHELDRVVDLLVNYFDKEKG